MTYDFRDEDDDDGQFPRKRFLELQALVKKHGGTVNGVEREYAAIFFPSQAKLSAFWKAAGKLGFTVENDRDDDLAVKVYP